MTLRLRLFIPLVLMMLLLPASRAYAHHGPPHDEIDEFADNAFVRGFSHPLTGSDHLFAGITVGLIAWRLGNRRGPVSAAVFVTAAGLGGVAGGHGQAVPMIGSALAASLLVLGAFFILGRKLHPSLTLPVLALLGFCHGNAHGLEGPGPVASAAYVPGFCLATGGLIAFASAACAAVRRMQVPAERASATRSN